VLKTNSGLSILLRCSWNVDFHGAGCGECALDVVAMVRCNERVRCVRRDEVLEAMVAALRSYRVDGGQSCASEIYSPRNESC
jgi:hypothetical protein